MSTKRNKNYLEHAMKPDKDKINAMFKDFRKDYSRRDRQQRDSWILFTIGMIGLCGIIIGLVLGKWLF